jgi:hypothetical protein
MDVFADEVATHGNKHHRWGEVNALPVVTHEASPSCHPSEGSINYRSCWFNS